MENQIQTRLSGWMLLTPERFHETIYRGVVDWYFYYNMDWESYLMYGMILRGKDYQIEGGAPAWFIDYVENYAITPFDCSGKDIALMFKKRWVRTILIFHLTDRVTKSGMVYNVSAKIESALAVLLYLKIPG